MDAERTQARSIGYAIEHHREKLERSLQQAQEFAGQSKLPIATLSELLGVSRQTLHTWRNHNERRRVIESTLELKHTSAQQARPPER